jgi:adenylate cyclase
VDALIVKGKTEPSRVFEVIDLLENASAGLRELADRFAVALSAYRRRNWDAAESELRACLQIRPGDGPSQVLLDRIGHFRERPPAADWNGAFQLDSK